VSRFLFVVPPLTGHINPTVSVAGELSARGHQVAWVGHRGALERLLPTEATRFELDDTLPEDVAQQAAERAAAARGPARLKFLWEEFFVPLARAMRAGVDAAIEGFSPDALIVDQQTVAGAIAARLHGLPWATLATTSAGVVDPLADLPKVRAWVDDRLAELQREAGLEPDDTVYYAPPRLIGFTTRELIGDEPLGDNVSLVGPSFARRRETTPFPWEWLDGRPLVLVSLGTVNADVGARFFREASKACGALPIQAVFVAPAEVVGPVADNIKVCDYVPQLAMLERASAVVSHAGHNTVVESLAKGLPLVVAPIKDDQPVVAQQVADAGAGLRVKFGRVKAPALRDALERVLNEPAFREAADRIRISFERAGGAREAAQRVEELV